MTTASQEFIDFHKGYSPLAQQMIAIFKEGNRIREETVGTIPVKMTAVLNWFKNDGGLKLGKLISEYLGVKIKKIRVSRNCDFGYAVLVHFGDPFGLNSALIFDRMSGRPVKHQYERIIETYKLYKPTYEELVRISNSYNAETGKFEDVKLGNGKEITATLYFDPYSAFLLKDVQHNKLAYLLPEEVAAIMIHECGHVVSCLLKAADLWFVSTAQNRVLQQFIKTAPITEKLKYLQSVVASSGKDVPILGKALELCFKLVGTDKESKGHAAFWPLVYMIVRCCFILLLSPFINAYSAIRSISDQLIRYQPNKLGDVYSNTKNIKYSEQLADSYAVRHGLGQYLSSALTKAESIPSFSGISSRKSSLVWYGSKLSQIFTALILPDLALRDEHERIVERQRSIATDTLKAFKSLDLSDDLKEFYIEDYEQQLEWMSKIPLTVRLNNKIRAAKTFLEYVLTVPMNMLISGRFNKEYDRLYKNVELLMGNDLAYRAAKLDLLAKQ